MKTAEQWAEEFDDLENEGVIDFVGKPEIRAIQADALRWALEQIAPRGSFAISAKLEELEDHKEE